MLSVYIRSDTCKHIFSDVRFALKERLQFVEILQFLSGLVLTLSVEYEFASGLKKLCSANTNSQYVQYFALLLYIFLRLENGPVLIFEQIDYFILIKVAITVPLQVIMLLAISPC